MQTFIDSLGMWVRSNPTTTVQIVSAVFAIAVFLSAVRMAALRLR